MTGETFGTEDPRTGEIYTHVAEAQAAENKTQILAAQEMHMSSKNSAINITGCTQCSCPQMHVHCNRLQ